MPKYRSVWSGRRGEISEIGKMGSTVGLFRIVTMKLAEESGQHFDMISDPLYCLDLNQNACYQSAN